MMLFEEGRVMLWHPVSRYLPEFKDAKVGAERAPAEPRDDGRSTCSATPPA